VQKRKLLWVGDAAVASGFARVTHHILNTLRETWNVYVLGLNYQGDPHQYPYPIYPCWPGGDPFGLKRVVEIINKVRPDYLIVQNDPWNIPAYIAKAGNIPVIATMPVDGKNCAGQGLNGLALSIFWTKFGDDAARLGGYIGKSKVVSLGVDLQRYYHREDARKMMGLPPSLEDCFIVGNVNRNQPRKRLDLSIEYFAEWVKSYGIRDAYLFLHVAPTGDLGFNVSQLMEYYGLSNRLIIAEPDIGQGISESSLSYTYSVFDVQISTSQGEGWGLTTMEGMACGVPQIVPDWSALGEWAGDAAMMIPCTSTAVTPNKVNVVGGIADKEAFIKALNQVYSDSELRTNMANKGLELVGRSEYRWENVGKRFTEAIDSLGIVIKGEAC
jgi:glycosyltransferase involved in cell wall biosynthesis